MSDTPGPDLVFVWEQFGSYHVDRLQEVARRFPDRRVVGIEIASSSSTYAWDPVPDDGSFLRQTLFLGQKYDEVAASRRTAALLLALRNCDPGDLFLCNINRTEILLAAVYWRLRHRRRGRVFAMLMAKFDDRQRHILTELPQWLALKLFSGGLVGGGRHIPYYQFLGMDQTKLATGYNSVSVERVRQDAKLSAVDTAFHDRHFLMIGRFVPKKQVEVVIRAYARYRRAAPDNPRKLMLAGSGGLEPQLRKAVEDEQIEGVEFLGFLTSEQIAEHLARCLSLILFSVGEQWGLVINEALAVGAPVITTENPGAREDLLRSMRNGYLVESYNASGLAAAMSAMASLDEPAWSDMSAESAALAPAGDVARFAVGVRKLTNLR